MLKLQYRTSATTLASLDHRNVYSYTIHMHRPPAPGSVLREYLGSMAVSAAAEHLRVTRVTLSRVLNGKSGISANMALRLAAALGTSPDLWMNMQAQHELWRARKSRQPTVRPFPHVAEQLTSVT
jgi:antitoxin HigA-1